MNITCSQIVHAEQALQSVSYEYHLLPVKHAEQILRSIFVNITWTKLMPAELV